jgi:hypothetical protein
MQKRDGGGGGGEAERPALAAWCVDRVGGAADLSDALAAAGINIEACWLSRDWSTSLGVAQLRFKGAAPTQLENLWDLVWRVDGVVRVEIPVLGERACPIRQEELTRRKALPRDYDDKRPLWLLRVPCEDAIGELAAVTHTLRVWGVYIQQIIHVRLIRLAPPRPVLVKLYVRLGAAEKYKVVEAVKAVGGVDAARVKLIQWHGKNPDVKGANNISIPLSGNLADSPALKPSDWGRKTIADSTVRWGPGRPKTPKNICEQVWGQLKLGRSFAEVARELGLSLPTVRKIGKKEGFAPRAQIHLSEEKRKALHKELERDGNFSRIARKFGVSNQTVGRIAKELGFVPAHGNRGRGTMQRPLLKKTALSR